MTPETIITGEVLDKLGFGPYHDKGGIITSHGRRHLDLDGPTNYFILEHEAHEGGTYHGYEVEAWPLHFTSGDFQDRISTIAELSEDIRRKCSPDEIVTFFNRLNKIS